MKNLVVFKLKDDIKMNSIVAAMTEDLMQGYKFKECGAHDRVRMGFSTNIDTLYVSSHTDGFLLKVTEQLKKPETNEVKKRIQEREKRHIEDTEQKPNKKLKDTWKFEVEEELLPLTFAKEPKTYKVFLRKDGLVLVEANYKKAEEILSLIRKVVGSLPVVPVETDKPVTDFLDSLITETNDDFFELLNKATLITQEDRTVSLSKAPLYDSEAQDLVEDGAMVTCLEMCYDGMVVFNLKDDFSFAGIKYDEQLSGDSDDDSEATAEYLQLVELGKVITEVISRLTEEE